MMVLVSGGTGSATATAAAPRSYIDVGATSGVFTPAPKDKVAPFV